MTWCRRRWKRVKDKDAKLRVEDDEDEEEKEAKKEDTVTRHAKKEGIEAAEQKEMK